MESVDIIYDLIQNDNSINTLNDNLELFQEFFYHDMSIRYNGLKVIEIYKYLLSLNLVDDNELFPYINSKIMHDFNSYIMQITQAVYTQNYYVKDECVDIIYNMIDTYNIFKEYNAKTELYQLEDEKQFIRDYTGAMIVLLNSSFFDISTDNIFKMINSIKNNEYLISIIESGKMGDNLLDQDYIFEYLSRFLFTTEFINEENIENDIFINSIKEGKIKDINTLKKMFNNLDINYLLMVLKNNLSLLVDILDNTNDDITIKQELFNIIKAKIEENDYIILLDFIMKDERYNLYITDDEKYKIINHLVMSEPTDLTDKQIFYLIKNGDRSLLSAFLINLKEILNNNNWRDSTRDIIEKATKSIITYEYDFESAIKDLDKFFKGEDSDMNYLRMYSIIRCLIKNILNDDTISVFFIHSNNCDGYAMNGKNVIGIEQRQIFDLCKTKNVEESPEIMSLFNIIYHESRHIVQHNLTNSEMDEKLYEQYKERIFRSINEGYYNRNYYGVTYEKDARMAGAEGILNFLKNHFPYLEKCIKYYEEDLEKEKQIEVNEKYFFELSQGKTIDEIMDKLLIVNPSIIDKYKELTREYNLDGTRISSINNKR